MPLSTLALPASLKAGLLWQGAGQWPGLGMWAPFLWGGLLALLAVALLRFWLPTWKINLGRRRPFCPLALLVACEILLPSFGPEIQP